MVLEVYGFLERSLWFLVVLDSNTLDQYIQDTRNIVWIPRPFPHFQVDPVFCIRMSLAASDLDSDLDLCMEVMISGDSSCWNMAFGLLQPLCRFKCLDES